MIEKKTRLAMLDAMFGEALERAIEIYREQAGAPGPTPTPTPTPTPNAGFRVFEIMGYLDQPDLMAEYGIEPLKIWYRGTFWPGGTPKLGSLDFSLPKRSLVEKAARKSPALSVIDIEHWPINSEHASKSVPNYLQVLQWFKEALPAGHKTGLYSTVPVREYWKVVRSIPAQYADWQRQNDLAINLARAVDVLYPSIYTFYPDRDGWRRYAIAQIKEARRLAPGKPVYAFLWPEYHPSNKGLKGRAIEPDYWRMQLDTMREHADGLVIWTLSGTRDIPFAQIPMWWLETVDFMRSL